MQRIKSIGWLIVSILLFSCSCTSDDNKLDSKKEIFKYKKLLSEEPQNCFYLGQLARGYQSLNDFDEAIKFFEKAVAVCPNDSLNIFELGVCHYVIMNKKKGIAYMDKAIEIEIKANNPKLSGIFKEEKKAWIEKWEQIKQLDWNKSKKGHPLKARSREKTPPHEKK